jgi:hypothetical protein
MCIAFVVIGGKVKAMTFKTLCLPDTTHLLAGVTCWFQCVTLIYSHEAGMKPVLQRNWGPCSLSLPYLLSQAYGFLPPYLLLILPSFLSFL